MRLDAFNERLPGKVTDFWLCNGGDPELLACAMPVCDQVRHLRIKPRTIDLDPLALAQPTPRVPYIVVHRHSITANHQIDDKPHRINLDMGAFRSGVLSSLRLGAWMDQLTAGTTQTPKRTNQPGIE